LALNPDVCAAVAASTERLNASSRELRTIALASTLASGDSTDTVAELKKVTAAVEQMESSVNAGLEGVTAAVQHAELAATNNTQSVVQAIQVQTSNLIQHLGEWWAYGTYALSIDWDQGASSGKLYYKHRLESDFIMWLNAWAEVHKPPYDDMYLSVSSRDMSSVQDGAGRQVAGVESWFGTNEPPPWQGHTSFNVFERDYTRQASGNDLYPYAIAGQGPLNAFVYTSHYPNMTWRAGYSKCGILYTGLDL
jgi:hypothetical protein